MSNNIIDNKYIYHITLYLISVLKLDDYIYNVTISNLPRNSLMRYLIREKKLVIDIKKTIYCVVSYIKNKSNCENKILLTNLYIVKILFHELEHAIQERKINCTDDYETKILVLSKECEEKIKINNLNFYNNFEYLYNPIERQANIVSTRRIIELSKNLFYKEILEFFYNEFLTQVLLGYKEDGFDYPLLKFFSGEKEFLRIFDKINKDKKIYFKERINLGLEITDNEYSFLKERFNNLVLKK